MKVLLKLLRVRQLYRVKQKKVQIFDHDSMS